MNGSSFSKYFAIISLILPGFTFSSSTYSTGTDNIRFGILSIAPPSRIHKNWSPFIQYVSNKMGRPIEIVIPRGFKKMRTTAANGEVDFFYINSRVLYRLKSENKADGILQMVNLDDKVTSQSEIYVHRDSGINNVSELKGKTIAYVSPMGAGGYLAPRAKLMSLGISGESEVKEVFTKNLSNSIHQVLLKDLNAGTMCGVNFSLMSKKMDTGELKVIEVSDEYPENVIATRNTLNKSVVTKFQKVIVDMPNTKEGLAILKNMHGMKITKFIPYDPKIESLTKNLLKQAKLKP